MGWVAARPLYYSYLASKRAASCVLMFRCIWYYGLGTCWLKRVDIDGSVTYNAREDTLDFQIPTDSLLCGEAHVTGTVVRVRSTGPSVGLWREKPQHPDDNELRYISNSTRVTAGVKQNRVEEFTDTWQSVVGMKLERPSRAHGM